jgi:hypothetical protein
VVAVIDVLLTTVTLVTAVPPKLTVAPVRKPVPVIVTAVPPAVVPEVGEIAVTVGGLALNVAICITQLELVTVPVALLLPVLVTTLSSAMSLSGLVMILEVNPLPAAVKALDVTPAPNISSLATVVVADPLLALVPLPAAPAVLSSGVAVSSPWYSSTRTSANGAAVLKVTVTELLPAAMFLA